MPRIYTFERGRPTLLNLLRDHKVGLPVLAHWSTRLKSHKEMVPLEGTEEYAMCTPLSKVTRASWFGWGCPSSGMLEILQPWGR